MIIEIRKGLSSAVNNSVTIEHAQPTMRCNSLARNGPFFHEDYTGTTKLLFYHRSFFFRFKMHLLTSTYFFTNAVIFQAQKFVMLVARLQRIKGASILNTSCLFFILFKIKVSPYFFVFGDTTVLTPVC